MKEKTLILSSDQQIALDRFIDHFTQHAREPDIVTRFHTISGFAGTGKTFLVPTILKNLPLKNIEIGICAPTNKAVNVLSEKIEETLSKHQLKSLKVEFSTLQAFLKMRPKRYANGLEEFIYDRSIPRSEIPATKKRFIIVDECSMVSKEMLNALNCLTYEKTFILFVGDPAQLPPINEQDSLSFHTDISSKLKKIIRQDEKSQIIPLSLSIRRYIEQRNKKFNPFTILNRLDKRIEIDDLDEADLLEKAYTNGPLGNERVLCYTNAKVDQYNHQFHSKFFPDSNWIYSENERIIICAPYDTIRSDEFHLSGTSRSDRYESSEFTLTNNEECIIEKINLDTGRIRLQDLGDIIELYKLEDREIIINELILRRNPANKSRDAQTVRVFVPQDNALVNEVTSKAFEEWKIVKNRAQREKDRQKSSDLYRLSRRCSELGWQLRDYFCSIRHSYAMTIHKSQGSTFDRVFVDVADINRIYDTKVYNQCMYVACTRPAKNLILLKSKKDSLENLITRS